MFRNPQNHFKPLTQSSSNREIKYFYQNVSLHQFHTISVVTHSCGQCLIVSIAQFESLHKIGFEIYITEILSEIEKARVVLLQFSEVGTYYSNCACKILPFIEQLLI